jgi:hypothetical protein
VSSRSNSLAHTNGRERGNARLRTAGALAQQVRLRLANIKVRTGWSQLSQDTEYGAPGRWELQHITAKTTTERWSCPLRCAALLWHASCSLHPHCTKFEPATGQQDFFLFDRTLVCVSPRPSPDVGGAGDAFVAQCAACRLSAHDPKAVQDGRMARQPLKIHRISLWLLVSPCDGRTSEPCEHTGFYHFRRGDYIITVLLAGT